MTGARQAIEAALAATATVPTLAELRERLVPAGSWSPERVFLLSAPSVEDLRRQLEELVEALDGMEDAAAFEDLGRSTRPPQWHELRAAVVAADPGEARRRLRQLLRKVGRHARVRLPSGTYLARERPVGGLALLFPGQGAQFPRMLVHLALRSRSTLDWFDELDRAGLARGLGALSPLLLQPEPDGEIPQGLLDLRTGAQLGLVSSLALAEVLEAWGLRPQLMVGHSNGEHAAVVAGGHFRFPSRARLAAFFCSAGLLVEGLPRPAQAEGVLAVGGAPRALLDRLVAEAPGSLFVAISNCPQQVVLAGTASELDRAELRLREAGASVLPVPIGRAYHTPLFADCAAALRRHYEALVPGVRHTPVVSCLSAGELPLDPDAVRDHIGQQWSRKVDFQGTVEGLYERGVRHFVEVGPGDKLSAFVRDTLRDRPHFAASASSRTRDDLLALKHLAAELAVFGPGLPPRAMAWLDATEEGGQGLEAGPSPGHRTPRQTSRPAAPPRKGGAPGATEVRVDPPTRARALHHGLVTRVAASSQRWEQRLGAPGEPRPGARRGTRPASSILEGCGARLRRGQRQGRCELTVSDLPWLLHHAFGRQDPPAQGSGGQPLAVLSFTTSMALLTEVGAACLGQRVTELRALKARRWLALDGGVLPLRFALREDQDGVWGGLWDCREEEAEPAFEAQLSTAARAAPGAPLPPPRGRGRPLELSPERFYAEVAFHGPDFRCLQEVEAFEGGRVTARVRPQAPCRSDALDPALWDCVGQLAALAMAEAHPGPFGLYPLWAERCVPGEPLGGTATPAHLHAQVELLGTHGTRTSARWTDAAGRELGAIEGLQQRLIPLHPGIQRLLAGRPGPTEVTAPGLATWLRTADPIWLRTLASRCLAPTERASWAQRPSHEQLPPLLDSIAILERPWPRI